MFDSKTNWAKTTKAFTVAGAISLTQIIPAQSAVSLNPSQPIASPQLVELALLVPPAQLEIESVIPVEKVFSASATGQITRVLNSAASECRSVAAEYRASCAADAYKRAARTASRPDYRAARSALNKAARDLNKLVSRNADKSAPVLKKGRRKYKAIKKAAVRKVAQQAVKIITETQTKLLRSSGSGLRKTHYQRIAKAVGSTKRIFRS